MLRHIYIALITAVLLFGFTSPAVSENLEPNILAACCDGGGEEGGYSGIEEHNAA